MSFLMGQHAVVTDGSHGIGKSIAIRLIGFGATVTIVGQDEETITSIAREIDAKPAVMDIADSDSIKQAFQRMGQVDILVNNAGISGTSSPFRHIEFDMWQTMLNANLTGTFLCTRAVLNGMVDRGYGRIINITGTAGLKGYPYLSADCTVQHGIVGMTKSLAREVATKGVTVNAICHGHADTELTRDTVVTMMERTGRSEEEAIAELIKDNPQGRLIQVQAIANMVVSLCDRTTGSITGQALSVDGGETA